MGHWIHKLVLKGKNITLLPMEGRHRQGLLDAAKDGKLWELWYTSVPSAKTIDAYIQTALRQKENGQDYAFVVQANESGEILGATRYYNLDPQNRRLEIGYTWYAKKHQRTGVNTECKWLMLNYAFENLNCIAVQFMTNWYNMRSRDAIARLGAKQDGVLRNHRLNPDGSYRDSVVFSITQQEWPNVKKDLAYKLKAYQGSPL